MAELLDDKFDAAFDNKEDLTEFANEFSEGDNLLKETLLNLWNNNIRTNSCCMGHETNLYSIPAYVSIVLDQNSTSLLYEIYSKLYPKYKAVTFGLYNNNQNAFTLHMRENTKEDTLNIINQSIGKNNEIDIPVLKNAIYILEYANKLSLKLHIDINVDKVYLEFKSLTDDTTYVEYKSLDESIESLSDLANVSHLFVMCEHDELDKIVDIFNQNKRLG